MANPRSPRARAAVVLLTLAVLVACGEPRGSGESNGEGQRGPNGATLAGEPIVSLPPARGQYSRPDSSQIAAVEDAMKRSASYLVKNNKENGMFEYRINLDPTTEVETRYNILRHAGAIYAMSAYYLVEPDDALRDAIARAGRYLRDESIGPISEESAMLAVWSRPEVNRSGAPLQAKLGGTGLGLVALLSIEKMHPGFTPLGDLRRLGHFIVYMQKEDGSFYSKYIPSLGGRQDDWESLLYPGESALGLLMLYEKDSLDVWLDSAAKALAYMAHTREGKTAIPPDHWALLATEKMLQLVNSDELPVSRELLVNHAIQICEAILRTQIRDPERPDFDGGFSRSGRTTPTATRLEGLLAALSFLPPDHEIRNRIDSAVHRGVSFLLRAQKTEGAFAGAVPRAVGNDRRATEVRIDYVQHALSAMIQYSPRILHERSISIVRSDSWFICVRRV